MSAGDILLTIVIWLYKNTILNLPDEIGFLPISTFAGYLDSFKTNISYALSGIAKLFPVDLLLILVSVIISGEILLFGIKGGTFVVNIIRGSGA
jgi:hypothetical protein